MAYILENSLEGYKIANDLLSSSIILSAAGYQYLYACIAYIYGVSCVYT